jgi:hypothetical protein
VAIEDIGNQRSMRFYQNQRIGIRMSEEKNNGQGNKQPVDPKEKYREALERKKRGGGIRNNNIARGPRVSGAEASGKTPKMFRRKSGSA